MFLLLTRLTTTTPPLASFSCVIGAFQLFRRHLINYADLLKSKLPKAAALEKENQMSVSMDLSEAQVGRVLRIVNTAVYLQEATEQVGALVRSSCVCVLVCVLVCVCVCVGWGCCQGA